MLELDAIQLSMLDWTIQLIKVPTARVYGVRDEEKKPQIQPLELREANLREMFGDMEEGETSSHLGIGWRDVATDRKCCGVV